VIYIQIFKERYARIDVGIAKAAQAAFAPERVAPERLKTCYRSIFARHI